MRIPTTALGFSVAVLPAFGVVMFGLRRYVAWTSPRAMRLIGQDASLVYLAVLMLGVVAVSNVGALPAAALVRPMEPIWLLVPAGLVLAPACALLPYWTELALATLLHNRHRLPISGLDGARESVTEVGADRVRFAAIAICTAVVEEVLFRGAVLYEVSVHRGLWLAVLAASLVFGLHHVSFGLPAMAGKALAGLLWAGLMLLTGLIVVPIAAHLLFQLLVLKVGSW